jgi:hypothetical protein
VRLGAPTLHKIFSLAEKNNQFRLKLTNNQKTLLAGCFEKEFITVCAVISMPSSRQISAPSTGA